MNVSFAERLCSAQKQSKMTQNEVTDVHMDTAEFRTDRLFNEERMYTYLKTYATVKGLKQTMRVLPYARELHKDQFRSGIEKIPYIYHPLMVACHALALGLEDDDVISAALLHDVCEDCGVLPEDLPVNDETKEVVRLLTREDHSIRHTEPAERKYYEGISTNPKAVIIKLLDRCNNVSSMATGFSPEKILTYIKNTEEWVYPLFSKARTLYPEYSNQIFLIKYHMTSVVEGLRRQL